MKTPKLSLLVGLLALGACTQKVDQHFDRAPLPDAVVPLYDEAAAFKAKSSSDGKVGILLDLDFLIKDSRPESVVIAPYDSDGWYEPLHVKLADRTATAELQLNRDFLVILDLGDTARNNYQAFTQLAAARGLFPPETQPDLCRFILCSSEKIGLDTIGERLPGVRDLPVDIASFLPPLSVGPVGRMPGANICDRCFERPFNVLPCLVWKWCGDFPIRRKLHVRKNVYSLTATEIGALRTGVAAMKARAPSDPTSWLYQARMHAVDSGAVAALQDQCQHRQFLFFSWHRMFIYYFERILRKASGDSTLALPYWNYTDIPGQDVIPAPYRLPADSSNPLYNDTRQAAYNSGVALPPADVSYSAGFALTNFTAASAGVSSFGGRTVSSPGHFPSSPGSGRIEQSPHNNVHNDVAGDMASGESPRDPLFWLHHANIDRLWKRWLALGNGRANPTGDTFWMTHVFSFFDENGAQVSLTGAQVLDTVRQLGYRYDDDPLVLWWLPGIQASLTMAPQRRFLAPEVLASARRPIRLGDKRVDMPIPLTAEGRKALAASFEAGFTRERLMLQLKNIEYDEPVGVTYLLFLNLPADARNPDHTHPSFIGTLGFFGTPTRHGVETGEGVAEEYDVTRTLRRAAIRDDIVLTALPSLPTAPPDRKDLQELVSKIKAKGNPRLGEIVLLRARME